MTLTYLYMEIVYYFQRTKNLAIIKAKNMNLALECMGDNIIVIEDRWRSGYECSMCDGNCYLDEPCPVCNGEIRDDYICSACYPINQRQNPDFIAQRGKKLCPKCNGLGATIVAPQESKRRPSSGTVVSTGPEVIYDERGNILPSHFRIRRGDRVLYTMFAGTVITLKQKEDIRIMHSHEVYCKIYGVGNIEDFIK